MELEMRRVDWPYASVFRIAHRAQTCAQTVLVELKDGPFTGRGEALGVFYHGETADSILIQLTKIKNALSVGISRADLQGLLPSGGARNAVDCALWDLEAKRAGKRAWELAGMTSVNPVITDLTLSLGSPDVMAQAAIEASRHSKLKLKLLGQGDFDRVAAVRAVRPDAELVVDPNQAWNEKLLFELAPKFAELGVKLIEQPLPVGEDDALAGFECPIPICADESCHTRESLPLLVGKYQYVNIKLDKTGGLTEALALAQTAREQGFGLMVGCTAGSSLSMAPAFLIGQLCDFVDLDGPLLAAADVPHRIRYEGGRMYAPEPELWG